MGAITNLSTLIFIIGVLALVVSVITEVFKNTAGLSKIPTSLLVFVLSVILTPLAYVLYCMYMEIAITLSLFCVAIVLGFFVALVAMSGWERVYELIDRFVEKKSGDK